MSYAPHSICDYCWHVQHGRGMPARSSRPGRDVCCFCGTVHQSGITELLHHNDAPCGSIHNIGEPADVGLDILTARSTR